MRDIEIDLDIHKLIETERKAFDEKENDILRRLLQLPPDAAAQLPSTTPAKAGRPWISQGVMLPDGTEAIAEYSGQTVRGEIREGAWTVKGHRYAGPSPALQSNVVTRSGKQTNLNGWAYWRVRQPGKSSWVSLNALRPASPTLEDLGLE